MVKVDISKMNEKQRRLFLGKEAAKLGYGGIQKVSDKYNVARGTVAKGLKEYRKGDSYRYGDAIRKAGGGRKSFEDKYPEIVGDIFAMMKSREGVYLSEREIAKRITDRYPDVHICSNTVGNILERHGMCTNHKERFLREQRRKKYPPFRQRNEKKQEIDDLGLDNDAFVKEDIINLGLEEN